MKLFPSLITFLSLGLNTAQGADPGQTIYGPDVNLSLSWGYVSVKPALSSILLLLPLIALTNHLCPELRRMWPRTVSSASLLSW